MKKFFALATCFTIVATLIFCVSHANAESKVKATSALHAVSMASVMAMHKPAANKRLYNELRAKYGKDRVIAQDMIRMERYLQNGATEYEFYHKLMSGDAITERKLNEQDGFLVNELGVFLMRESTTIPGIGQLSTYPNPQQFPDGAAGFTVNEHLEVIYNGVFAIKIGDTQWMPGMPIMDCRVCNTAQQTAIATNDSERRAGDGMIDVIPFFLKGRENNQLKLLVPGNALQKLETDFGTVGFKIKVVTIMRGFKITGAGRTA